MPRPGRMTTESAKDFKGTLRQLIGTMGHYKLPLITAIVFAILSTIAVFPFTYKKRKPQKTPCFRSFPASDCF